MMMATLKPQGSRKASIPKATRNPEISSPGFVRPSSDALPLQVGFFSLHGVVFGNEARGLGPELEPHLDGYLTIPMAAGESLNVAMAATIVCFEAARQLRAGR